MRSKPELRLADYLGHIIDAVSRIERYAALVADEKEFQSNALIQDAIVRNLDDRYKKTPRIARRFFPCLDFFWPAASLPVGQLPSLTPPRRV